MNTSHYPSLELCKKLTEARFPATEKWFPHNNWSEYYVYPAIMEILDKIPDLTVVNNEVYWLQMTKWSVEYYSNNMEENIFEAFKPLPDALAYTWLWMKENNYLPTK